MAASAYIKITAYTYVKTAAYLKQYDIYLAPLKHIKTIGSACIKISVYLTKI